MLVEMWNSPAVSGSTLGSSYRGYFTRLAICHVPELIYKAGYMPRPTGIQKRREPCRGRVIARRLRKKDKDSFQCRGAKAAPITHVSFKTEPYNGEATHFRKCIRVLFGKAIWKCMNMRFIRRSKHVSSVL